MNNKVLFVDDDPEILLSFERYLKRHFDIYTSPDGEQALSTASSDGPFAVVVADMHMPGMDGLQLLKRMEASYPNTIRVMLTGKADLQLAMDAVNNGRIFRFLTKPCPNEMIIMTLEAGIKQFHLEIAERELLEQTLHGSINIIIEILRLRYPALVSRTNRGKKIVQHVVKEMKLRSGWQFELALSLSQIGFLAYKGDPMKAIVSQDYLTPAGQREFMDQCHVGSQLLKHIPRLENIAAMIQNLWKPYNDFLNLNISEQQEFIALGSQILRVSLDLDTLCMKGNSIHEALRIMEKREGFYNPALLSCLHSFSPSPGEWNRIFVGVEGLRIGMIADQDIHRKDGTLMLSKNEEITGVALKHLQTLHDQNSLSEPFYVLVK